MITMRYFYTFLIRGVERTAGGVHDFCRHIAGKQRALKYADFLTFFEKKRKLLLIFPMRKSMILTLSLKWKIMLLHIA